jgi:hypothetical protein
MIAGSLTVTLRPLRLALVVAPGDEAALADAIRINSYLWGGQYNPIIPLFRKLPAWVGPFSRPENSKEFVASYLRLFDPDYLIRLGDAKDHKLEGQGIKEIPADEMLNSINSGGPPVYGVGFFETLRHLLHEEFRFVRNDSLHMRFPAFSNQLFLASVFGAPMRLSHLVAPQLTDQGVYREDAYSLDNYLGFLELSNLFPRRISHYGLKSQRRAWWQGDYVFLMDGTDPNDILLYWNYRALGWKILPVPLSVSNDEAVRKFVAEYVESNYWPHSGNPAISNFTTILASPNVRTDQLEKFKASLDISPVSDGTHFKLALCSWLPRFWDEWARHRDGAERGSVWSTEKRLSVRIENKNFQFDPLLPDFVEQYSGYGKPRCANLIDLNTYGDSVDIAQVVPAGGDKLAGAVRFAGREDIRCSTEGIVFYPKAMRWTETLEAPSAQSIFSAWFEERGWKVSLSDKGYIIKQLLSQIGGRWGTNWLTKEPVFRFLNEIPSCWHASGVSVQGTTEPNRERGTVQVCGSPSGMVDRVQYSPLGR